MKNIPLILKDGRLVPKSDPLAVPGALHVEYIADACRVYQIGDALPDPPEPSLEALKNHKRHEIIAAANAAVAEVKARYSDPEVDSWQRQEAEARELLANKKAVAPLVRALAANRGMTAAEFAAKIIANAEAAEKATTAILLRQQALEEAVKAAENVATVRGIVAIYTDRNET